MQRGNVCARWQGQACKFTANCESTHYGEISGSPRGMGRENAMKSGRRGAAGPVVKPPKTTTAAVMNGPQENVNFTRIPSSSWKRVCEPSIKEITYCEKFGYGDGRNLNLFFSFASANIFDISRFFKGI